MRQLTKKIIFIICLPLVLDFEACLGATLTETVPSSYFLPNTNEFDIKVKPSVKKKKPKPKKKPKKKSGLSCGVYHIGRPLKKGQKGSPWKSYAELDISLKEVTRIAPANDSQITGMQGDEDFVKFEWEGLGSKVRYRIDIFTGNHVLVFTKEIRKTFITVKLPVGLQYQWRVSSLQDGCKPKPQHEWAFKLQKGGECIVASVEPEPLLVPMPERILSPATPAPEPIRLPEPILVPPPAKIENVLSLSKDELAQDIQAPRTPSTVVQPPPLPPATRTEGAYKHLDLITGYPVVIRQHTSSSPVFASTLQNVIPNSMTATVAGFYNQYGLYINFAKGNRHLAFPNKLQNQIVDTNLHYSHIGGGPIIDYNSGNFGFVAKGIYANEDTNLLKNKGPIIFDDSNKTSIAGIALGPKFNYGTYHTSAYLGTNLLLSSSPFKFKGYRNYNLDLVFEKEFNSYFSGVVEYSYDYTKYTFQEDGQLPIANSINHQSLNFLIKVIIH